MGKLSALTSRMEQVSESYKQNKIPTPFPPHVFWEISEKVLGHNLTFHGNGCISGSIAVWKDLFSGKDSLGYEGSYYPKTSEVDKPFFSYSQNGTMF
jgi:hypothetical protein